jgi:citrate synthase
MEVMRTGCSVLGNLEPECGFAVQHDAANRLLAVFPSMLTYWGRFHADGQRIKTGTVEDSVAEHGVSSLTFLVWDRRRMPNLCLIFFCVKRESACISQAI